MDFKIQIAEAMQESHPTWAIDPKNPRFREIRRGILYTGISIPTLEAIMKHDHFDFVKVCAAMGPDLFFGRSDGPWIPYDLDAKDQNAGIPIRARSWPWCWGDQIWILGRFYSDFIYLRMAPYLGHLFLTSFFSGSVETPKEFAEIVRGITPHFGIVPSAGFLRSHDETIRDQVGHC